MKLNTDEIRAAMARRKMTPCHLVVALHQRGYEVSHATVDRWIRGLGPRHLPQVRALASALGTSSSRLIVKEDKK